MISPPMLSFVFYISRTVVSQNRSWWTHLAYKIEIFSGPFGDWGIGVQIYFGLWMCKIEN